MYNEKTYLWEETTGVLIFKKGRKKLMKYLRKIEKKLYSNLESVDTETKEGARQKKDIDKGIKSIQSSKVKLETAQFQRSIIAQLVNFFPVKPEFVYENLNQNPRLMPLKGNTVIDLYTGTVSTRRKIQYFSYEVDVSIIKDIEFGKQFFLDISNGDSELAHYLAVLFRYYLTGHTWHRSIYQFNGVGRNGKSLCQRILTILSGEQVVYVHKSLVVCDPRHPDRSEAPSPQKLSLRGKRLALITNTDNNDLLHGRNVKLFTGSDTIQGRQLYSKKIENFVNSCKIVICSNFTLNYHTSDTAIDDRNIIIPFNNRFEVDSDFFESIVKNKDDRLSSIFSYIMSVGTEEMGKMEISPPECLIHKLEEDKEEHSPVISFLSERCTRDVNPDRDYEFASDLYDAFKNYCLENGYGDALKQISFKKFNRELCLIGMKKVKKRGVNNNGKKVYQYGFLGINIICQESMNVSILDVM